MVLLKSTECGLIHAAVQLIRQLLFEYQVYWMMVEKEYPTIRGARVMIDHAELLTYDRPAICVWI